MYNMVENNWAVLMSRIMPGHSCHQGIFYEVSGLNVEPKVVVEEKDKSDLERILRKLDAATRDYSIGRSRYCTHQECLTSRKIVYASAWLDIPVYKRRDFDPETFVPGIVVNFECNHSRVYLVNDPSIPHIEMENPYAQEDYDPHRLKSLLPKILEARRTRRMSA